jgi:acetyl esterase/lipase
VLSSSNFVKTRRGLSLVSLLLFSGLLLAACGDTTVSPTLLPTVAATLTVAPSGTAAATNPSTGTATPTPVPPTPQVTLPPEISPSVAATTAPPLNTSARPPQQPASGPGGQDYPYKSVLANRYGQGDESYYIFEPAQPAPAKPLPVIAFLHGYAGVNPDVDGYSVWITHLVRRGNILVFPVYQGRDSTDGTRYTDNALAGLKAALQKLQDGTHARPDLANFSLLGYSAGGVIATNLAVRAEKSGLPVPKTLVAVSPGGCANCSIFAVRNFTLAQPAELATIPAATRLLVIVGNQDIIVGKSAAELIWQNTAQVPAANKNYLEFDTDNYGTPGLVADHGMATRHNAFNFNGIWKVYDALESCSIEGKSCEVALGNTPQQRSLGTWSDGTPVKEITVLG